MMKKSSFSFLCLVLLGLFLFIAGCTQAGPATSASSQPVTTTIPPENYTSNETLVAFVSEAAEYVKTHGTEAALAEFNNPDGSFIRGELYIYAYGFNETTLAHPINPETVGKTREGAIGVFVDEMDDAVRNGSGFYRFTYINPLHDNALEAKMGYGVQVEEDWWLGSGVYTGPVNP